MHCDSGAFVQDNHTSPASPMSYYTNSAPAAAGGDPAVAACNGYAGESYTFYNGGGAQPADPQIRTIVIHGFPPNLRERELNNLLLFLPGYQVRRHPGVPHLLARRKRCPPARLSPPLLAAPPAAQK